MTVTSTEVIPFDDGEPTGTGWINQTGLPNQLIEKSLRRELARWTDGLSHGNTTRLSLFDRKAYETPEGQFKKFKVARAAVANDDVVSGVVEVTCGLTFQGMKWESSDSDVSDVFNQMSRDLNMDQVIRQWYKEDFTYSQVIVGMWWGQKEYKVRGSNIVPEKPHALPNENTGLPEFHPKMDEKTGKPKKPKKVKRKKTYDMWCPVGMTFLDPMRVIPLSPSLFGRDRLAWQSNAAEMKTLEKVKNGEVFDEIMQKFFQGQYKPENRAEKDYLENMGVDTRYLILLNPDCVFRIAPGRVPYERFADLRLNSVFPLLDLKQQLIEADRVALIGQANYILLVRVGEKDHPAQDAELQGARAGVMNLGKIPLIVGDHRLQIDILTPDQSFSLDQDRYDTIDTRILARCLGALSIGSQSNQAAVDATSAGIAKVLEGRRHMMKRAFEDFIARKTVEHPRNKTLFQEGDEPNLAFIPRNISLGTDAQMIQAVMSLRTQKELSRESTLERFGFDQAVEAQRREYEEESGLDDIFQTAVPFNGEGGGSPQTNGAQGGRPNGGGNSPQSPQGNIKPKTRTGSPTTAKPKG